VDHFFLLEIDSGGGQNFSFYERSCVVRVEAVEPDEAMLASARRSLEDAPVPIRLARVPVEALPFPDAHSESAVVMLIFYSVRDPARAQAGGTLLLLEHVRAQGKVAAWIQDALVPLSTRCMGNCHWNRDTGAMIQETGFVATQVYKKGGGLQPVLLLHAMRPQTREGDVPLP
jgi:Methyltransferase domain